MDFLNFDLLPRTFSGALHSVKSLSLLAGFSPVDIDSSSAASLTRLFLGLPPEFTNKAWFPGCHASVDYASALTGRFSDKFHRYHLERVLSGRTSENCLADGLAVASPKTLRPDFMALVKTGKSLPIGIGAALSCHRLFSVLSKADKSRVETKGGIVGTRAICGAFFGNLRNRDISWQITDLFRDSSGYGRDSELAAIRFFCERQDLDQELARKIVASDPSDYQKNALLFSTSAHQSLVSVGHTPAFRLFAESTGDPALYGMLISPAVAQEGVIKLYDALPGLLRQEKKLGQLQLMQASFLRHPQTPLSLYQALISDKNPHVPAFLGDINNKPSPFAFDVVSSEYSWMQGVDSLAVNYCGTPAQRLLGMLYQNKQASLPIQDVISLVDHPNVPLEALNKSSSFFSGNVVSGLAFQDQEMVLPFAVAGAIRNRNFSDFLAQHIDYQEASVALLMAPSTSARRLEAIARQHPDLEVVCAGHPNGRDICASDPVIDDIRETLSEPGLIGKCNRGSVQVKVPRIEI